MQSVNVSIFACFPNVSLCVDFSLLYLWLCYIMQTTLTIIIVTVQVVVVLMHM